MYKLLAISFCCVFFSTRCRNTNANRLSVMELEEKLIQAAQKANHFILERRAKREKNPELMITSETVESLTEPEAIQIVQPLIDPSVSFLQGYYDINIYQYFPAGSPEIARLGALALRFKQLEDQGKAIDTSQMNTWFGDNVAQANNVDPEILSSIAPSILDCAMDALGIPAALIVESAKSLSRAALIKAATKLASRTLGWISLGIAIYEFGDCMDWW